jgi:hypothetical protein
MKQLILLFFWLIALHLIGFTQIHPGSGLSLDKIMLDPSSGVGGTASQIYDEVDYIPLETTKESLFGEISQLQITDKYFIILDKETDAILFFNRDGSFHHKINKFPFDEKYLSRIELNSNFLFILILFGYKIYIFLVLKGNVLES